MPREVHWYNLLYLKGLQPNGRIVTAIPQPHEATKDSHDEPLLSSQDNFDIMVRITYEMRHTRRGRSRPERAVFFFRGRPSERFSAQAENSVYPTTIIGNASSGSMFEVKARQKRG